MGSCLMLNKCETQASPQQFSGERFQRMTLLNKLCLPLVLLKCLFYFDTYVCVHAFRHHF